MARRIAVLSLAVVLALFLAACQSGPRVGARTVPLSRTPGLAPSSPTDPPRPIEPTIRDSGAGGVTVEATWLGQQEDGGLAFKVALDTHSVDLSRFDVATNLVLRDDGGRELQAGSWQDERLNSHHRAGLVRFPALPPGGATGRVTLVVRNLAGVPERALTFEFAR